MKIEEDEEKKKETDFALELRSLIHHRCRSSISSSVRERASFLVKHASSSSHSHHVNYRF
jgi:hypothetical protein